MAHRDEIIRFLNDYLQIDQINDGCPNGLQVEGKEEVRFIVTAVSASAELFERAAAAGADMVMVHHGILWERESRVIKGGFRRRIETLLRHGMTLAAYHLPLDKHPEIGNNALAAEAFGLSSREPFAEVGFLGNVSFCSIEELKHAVADFYDREPLVFAYGPKQIARIGICSGGAEKYIVEAVERGLDAFITGEVAEATMHLAKEGNIHFIAAGHYATERPSIRALGELTAARFGVKAEFIDLPNPI